MIIMLDDLSPEHNHDFIDINKRFCKTNLYKLRSWQSNDYNQQPLLKIMLDTLDTGVVSLRIQDVWLEGFGRPQLAQV